MRRPPLRLFLIWLIALALALASISFAPFASADPRTEGIAKAALNKAEGDFLVQNFGAAAARLDKALKACGAKRCVPATRAALLRDLGVMAFRKGDKDRASRYFANAVKAYADVAMNPAYDSPDVHGAFATAKGGGAAESGGDQPSGDFAHTPPAEQRVDTPLPIYVEGGGEAARVIVKYQSPGSSSWKRIDLKRVGDGWGGLIPCGDVVSGTLRYYIQGLDSSQESVASNGNPRHPYTVQIKDDISGEPPHLPGKKAPASCQESSDCPPDFPGCSKKGASAGQDGEDSGAEKEEKEAKDEGSAKASFKRIWVGVAGAVDLQSIPAGPDLCRLNPTGPQAALPANSANIYCTNPDGSDFPARTLPYGPLQNDALVPGSAGRSGGGVHRGDVRLMLTFDYALTANILVGARAGVTLYKYPGQAAYNDGRAWSLANGRLYFDARGSYLFGQDAIQKLVAPMVFAGLGAASFDTSVSAGITLQNGQSGTVNLWQTNGPFFLLAGGGVHVAMTETLAGVLALRVNGSFGANGFIPTIGPEAALQLGF